MAFNIQRWAVISGSTNNRVVTLQDGETIGAPNVFTYISDTDTTGQIEAANYFSEVVVDISVGDLIYAVGTDGEAFLTVLTVDVYKKTVTVAVQVQSGDVDGPNSSTDDHFALFSGTTGKIIKDAGYSIVPGGAGGTGVNNGVNTITIDGNLNFADAFATVGNFPVTFTFSGITNVTFPTSGTLATIADLPTLPLPMADGGSGKSLVADNGGIVYSDADSMELLAATAAAGQMLRSGANAAPTWSTATWPATTTVNQILYSSSANTVAGLPTANYGFLQTSSAGAPSVGQSFSNIRTITQNAHGFVVGDCLYLNSTTYTKGQADAAATSEIIGVVAVVIDANNFVLQFGGLVTGLTGLTAGATYYLSPTTAGLLTGARPVAAGQTVKPLLVADSTTSGYWTNLLGVTL